MVKPGNIWAQVLEADLEESKSSWEDVLEPDERVGGPSPTGNSYYSVFEQCPYKWWVQFVKRMKPDYPRPPLEIGGLFHECRARYYNAYLDNYAAYEDDEIDEKELDDRCLNAVFELLDRCDSVVPQTSKEVRRLIRGWITVYGPETAQDDRHETIDVEALVEVDRGFPYSTRFDRIAWSEELDGPVIMEIKTASRLTEDLVSGYKMDPQFLGQQYCWRHSKWYRKYGPLKAFVVDLTVKTKELRFQRITVPINNSTIRDWEKQKRHTYMQMLMCEALGYYPRMRSNCVKFVARCGLTEHCTTLGKGAEAFPGWRKKEVGEY